MDAIFTLPYSEFKVADMFAREFKAKHGYSVFVPASRIEKGIDLVLTRRLKQQTRCLTFQIKSSRTYAGTEPKRKVKNRRYQHYTWLNRFAVPTQADYVVLFGVYPSDERSGRKLGRSWWQSHVMIFSHTEMQRLMSSVKTRTGKPDKMFGFGFDAPNQAFLTRGNETGEHIDYSKHLFEHQAPTIRKALGERGTKAR